ncbi:tail protein [Pectobacterium phage Arno160]|uniref:Tail tubular protein A n=1 Tax=Pectobacterium phage Arno160 TaxID=2488835 RepID=A0A3G8F283_9CAUD|nr:tail protein [Pectobacterium phage Arno160]AZF88098.1 tail tubular protein A [Pectobacterium phage Arno160]
MAITELDVVNACLATLGEIPLVELQDDHPLVAAARQNMKESIIAEMHRQWWFNTDHITLKSAADSGFVYVPADAIAVDVYGHAGLTMRGRRLYDSLNSTYELSGTFYAVVVRELPFTDLPVTAQLLVQHATVLRFQINYDADEAKTMKQSALYDRQYRLLNAEHTRQVSLNGLQTPSVMTRRLFAGAYPRRRGGIPTR